MGWKYDAKAKPLNGTAAKSFMLNGAVTYRGEGRHDTGTITVTNNVVTFTGPAA
jgi:hypothetical protein